MPIKAIVDGVEKEITRIPVLVNDVYKDAWEVRDNQDRPVWYRNDTLTGISSISFKGYGLPLKSETVKGRTSQNGTPAPDAPVDVVGCGEKTENLFDEVYPNIGATALYKSIFVGEGEFTLSTTCTRTTANTANIFFLAGNVSSGVSTNGNGIWNGNDRTVTSVDGYVTIAYRRYSVGDTADPLAAYTMLNTGSTVLPYEPYGYSIPLVANSVNYPIYLGEVQTVRKIRKVVFDGTEDGWVPQQIGPDRSISMPKSFFTGGIIPLATLDIYCTHFLAASDQTTLTSGEMYSGASYLNFNAKNLKTKEAMQQWLASQYSAGTPMCVWYVLATPETGIVNEPLMKIGDYADEVTANTAILTSVGTNTFSVNTTLAPSGCSITGHIKSYTVMTYIDYTDMTKSYTIGDVNKVNAFTQRRRCNMLDDGTITAYYGDPTFVEDGSNGQVMVYQPKFYYKVEPVLLDGIKIRKCKYYISDYQLPGYKLHPAFIDRTDPNNLKEFPFVCIGAYEGCLQNGSTYITDDSASSTSYKLSSIAFTDTATNGVKPSSGIISPFGTIGNYETTASNRGTGWHIENIWIASMNQLMFVIEMCNPNSQTTLGSGVTNIPDTPNTANNSSLVGSTSSLGNGSGRATTTYSNYNGTTTAQTDDNKTAVSYRGMENPFGNIWKWIDGMTIKNTSATEHVPYICKSFAYTRNSTLTNYDMVNVTIPGNGYVTAFGYDPNFDWLFISAETNSSNTGAIRDYLYTTNTGYTCALLGGYWHYGASAGLFYWNLNNGSGDRSRTISARICYLPQ